MVNQEILQVLLKEIVNSYLHVKVLIKEKELELQL